MDSTKTSAEDDALVVDLDDRASVLGALNKHRDGVRRAMGRDREAREALEKAMASHDRVAIDRARFNYEHQAAKTRQTLERGTFLLSQLHHLDAMKMAEVANNQAKSLKLATWALVFFTIVLGALTIVAAFIARA